jgi:hypothetical protein
VVSILIHTSEALRIDKNGLKIFVSCTRDSFFPDPQTLGAGVDGRPDLKARLLGIQQHSIHEEAFPCSVLTNNANGSYFLLLGQLTQKLLGLGIKCEPSLV